MPKERSAGAIIYRKEGGNIYYLLLHYPTGHWEFPKGHIEGRETEEETVRREIREETGITDLRILPGFKKYIKYFFRQYKDRIPEKDRIPGKVPWVFKLVTFFVAETHTKDVKISHEHKGFLWLPIEQAIKRTTFKNSKKLLQEADDFVQGKSAKNYQPNPKRQNPNLQRGGKNVGLAKSFSRGGQHSQQKPRY